MNKEDKIFLKEFSDVEPEIVRPQITKMKLNFKSTSKTNKKKGK